MQIHCCWTGMTRLILLELNLHRSCTNLWTPPLCRSSVWWLHWRAARCIGLYRCCHLGKVKTPVGINTTHHVIPDCVSGRWLSFSAVFVSLFSPLKCGWTLLPISEECQIYLQREGKWKNNWAHKTGSSLWLHIITGCDRARLVKQIRFSEILVLVPITEWVPQVFSACDIKNLVKLFFLNSLTCLVISCIVYIPGFQGLRVRFRSGLSWVWLVWLWFFHRWSRLWFLSPGGFGGLQIVCGNTPRCSCGWGSVGGHSFNHWYLLRSHWGSTGGRKNWRVACSDILRVACSGFLWDGWGGRGDGEQWVIWFIRGKDSIHNSHCWCLRVQLWGAGWRTRLDWGYWSWCWLAGNVVSCCCEQRESHITVNQVF